MYIIARREGSCDCSHDGCGGGRDCGDDHEMEVYCSDDDNDDDDDDDDEEKKKIMIMIMIFYHDHEDDDHDSHDDKSDRDCIDVAADSEEGGRGEPGSRMQLQQRLK